MYTVTQVFEGEERRATCATAAEAVLLAGRWEVEGPRAVITSPAGFAGYLEALRELALSGGDD